MHTAIYRISAHWQRPSLARVDADDRYAGKWSKGFDALDLDLGRLATVMTSRVWSPIVWSGGHRLRANLLSSDLMALDFDDGAYTLAQALKDFSDSMHVIGVTKNHQKSKHGKPACDRFRVVVPWEARIKDRRAYEYNMHRTITRYGADPSGKDGARLFWPCPKVVSVQTEGYAQEVFEPPPEAPRAAAHDYALYRAHKHVPPWAEAHLRFGAADGTRNTTCFKLGIELTRCGFEEEEIVQMIMKSPIPIGPHVIEEVRAAVRNGARRGREEIAREGQEEETSHT